MMVKKFFQILSIEFSDLEESINILIDSVTERHEREEITEYVKKANSALLKRELVDMLFIHHKIMEFSPDDFATVEEASSAIINLINNTAGMPKAVHMFMENRVKKVLRYMNEVC